MALYKYGQDSTSLTADQVKAVLPLVERLKNAWASLTSQLNDLSERLLADAGKRSLTGDWDIAKLRLENAKATWHDLKLKAERYSEFQPGRADNLDEAME